MTGTRRRAAARERGAREAGSPVRLFVLCAALAAGVSLAAAEGRAQIVRDPTRPPAALAQELPEGAEAPAGPVLQSVLISPAGRLAIISGERVALGQKYGDAVLVRITETEAVLKSAAGLQVLKLYPGVEKRDAAPARERAARRAKRSAPQSLPPR